ncbi:hypothetical protein Ga0466249_003434 [Sporomusaceae bacterium BoRhaA]|nr:hypothetical protein [Pelorhabdus rhamnosifermentans]
MKRFVSLEPFALTFDAQVDYTVVLYQDDVMIAPVH